MTIDVTTLFSLWHWFAEKWFDQVINFSSKRACLQIKQLKESRVEDELLVHQNVLKRIDNFLQENKNVFDNEDKPQIKEWAFKKKNERKTQEAEIQNNLDKLKK